MVHDHVTEEDPEPDHMALIWLYFIAGLIGVVDQLIKYFNS